jgi:pimeloyl-ACP methyl ester carboxylesterase
MNARTNAARALAGVVGLAAAVALAGAAYNFLSIEYHRSRAGTPGKLYKVDGFAMHLYCTGRGSPTLVLDAGLGDDFLSWAKVQPALSRVTTVCSYDRAGFGWSEPRPGRPDANAVAAQLHRLTLKAGIVTPFILMGHSISGLTLRAYAAHYPADLAGLVFVDGSTPLQDDRIPSALVKIQDESRRRMPWQRLLMTLGWYRFHGDCDDGLPTFEPYATWAKADVCIPSQMTAIENALDATRASGEETVNLGPFSPLPILILSRDPLSRPANWPIEVGKANAAVWAVMQEEAKKLSVHSRRVIARQSDHYIQDDRPDLVIGEVSTFVSEIRAHRSSEADGTTVEK